MKSSLISRKGSWMVPGARHTCFGCKLISPGSLTLHTCCFHTEENKRPPFLSLHVHNYSTWYNYACCLLAGEDHKDYTLYSVRSIYKMFPSMHECRVYPGYYKFSKIKQNLKAMPVSSLTQFSLGNSASWAAEQPTQAPAWRKGSKLLVITTLPKQKTNNNDNKTVMKSRPSF